ncbi:hypothetical protein DCAR_0206481 [Daucus carota subsp. sativus]|uniref:Uncharacterized protein n=1 Tax=Daucus carota subsp. sativus TaxID=79200 RepID=A0AAF0WFC2_DAUCS|nr:hypothetical protein DCAR_0206481 [Daucus carota subsp. sativus]
MFFDLNDDTMIFMGIRIVHSFSVVYLYLLYVFS